jgi:hypothetical protein
LLAVNDARIPERAYEVHDASATLPLSTDADSVYHCGSVPDRAFAVFPQHVVERFRHQRLKTSTLTPGKGVHSKRHVGAEESGNLFATLAADWAGTPSALLRF